MGTIDQKLRTAELNTVYKAKLVPENDKAKVSDTEKPKSEFIPPATEPNKEKKQ